MQDLAPTATMIVILASLMAVYRSWFREHPVVMGVLGFVLFVGALGVVVTFWERLRQEREEIEREEQKRQVYHVWYDTVLSMMKPGASLREAQLRAWGRILALTMTPEERQAVMEATEAGVSPGERDSILERVGLARWLRTQTAEEREIILDVLRAEATEGVHIRPALERNRIARYAPIYHPKTGALGPVEPFPASLVVMWAEYPVNHHVRTNCILSEYPDPVSAAQAHFVAACMLDNDADVHALDEMKRLARRLLNSSREEERKVVEDLAALMGEAGVSWEQCASLLRIPTEWLRGNRRDERDEISPGA